MITKKQWFAVVIVNLLIIIILLSLSLRRDAISNPEAPSNYSYGAIASFSFLDEADANSAPDATARIVHLGQKPLLRLEQLHIASCVDAHVFMVGDVVPNQHVDLGKVTYLVGNSNYELPLHFNVSQYPKVQLWCDTTNKLVAVANLRN